MADRSELESKISSDVRALSAVSEEIGRAFGAQHHLRHNDFRALLLIMVADVEGAPLTTGELGARLGLSSAAMTYLVDRMIESGHIRREKDDRDRRKVILRYADHGMAVAREFFGPLGIRTNSALADVPDSDLAAAHRVFVALIGSMRAHHEELLPRST
ncbi:MarR family winged helix-turn-helix transcriptional regulator [Rhodococcus sp. 1168]|uniref:MarR family winged helix-turn-helix transcriptional regulator n=1 Tax=Rhodococcus sp. 1168 TaxID=2018041 RepID=UPI000A0B6409|nr:MarR family winged helix-turn-helix transcriptional regulator [Rhodococcus sp. 1168]ORI15421.1 MarR family transcriptional regulator [Rhodococcus sp. 1168]